MNAMKNKIIIFSLLLSLGFLFACEKTEKLEDFPLYPPKLVLNSFLNPDSTVSIHLSKSLSVLDNADLKNIDDGTIKLYENGSQIATLNTSDGDGNYRYNYNPKIGASYSVEASAPSLSNISSTTLIPSPVSIDKFDAEDLNSNEWSHPYKFSITIKDPPGKKNYYMFKVFYSLIDMQVIGSDTLYYEDDYHYSTYLTSSNNPAVDDVFGGNAFFTDDFFDGKTYTMDANVEYLGAYAYKIKFLVKLYSLSEANYKYRLSFGKYIDSRDNPFAEPVQVYNNIKGGYGIFGGEVVSMDSLIIDGLSY